MKRQMLSLVFPLILVLHLSLKFAYSDSFNVSNKGEIIGAELSEKKSDWKFQTTDLINQTTRENSDSNLQEANYIKSGRFLNIQVNNWKENF